MSTPLKFLTGTLIALILVGLALWGVSQFAYSEGTRAGIVVKISKKGYLFKTYEGQLNKGMIINELGNDPENPVSASNTWDFSLVDEDVYKQLEEAQRDGSRVNLHYEEKILHFFWNGDTKYFVTKVDKAQP